MQSSENEEQEQREEVVWKVDSGRTQGKIKELKVLTIDKDKESEQEDRR